MKTSIAGIQDDANGNGGQLVFLTETSGGTTTERIRIDSSGRTLLGPGAVASPKASTSGLDVSSGIYSIIMGGETNVGDGTGRRDGYQKESRLGMPHFTVSE